MTDTPEEIGRVREERRRIYIRQHAPTILAGMLGGGGVVVQGGMERLRAEAIDQAGRIFDETVLLDDWDRR